LGYKATEEITEGEMHDHHKKAKTQEIQKLKKRLIFAIIFGLPLIYMVMGGMLGLPIPQFFKEWNILIQFILATIVILVCFNLWIFWL